ncbi:MAG TPA: SMP-30/gluconolactonase/LRE family protein, partial [Stenomitos sp.]
MKPMTSRLLLALGLAFLQVACTPATDLRTNTGNPTDTASLVSNNSAGFAGHVTVPSQLIQNNAGGLISNNTANFRIASLETMPLANSLIYLLTPNEEFYQNDKGDRIVTTTDKDGNYDLPLTLSAGKQVIVSALLSGNRRMVGYTLSKEGKNAVDVNLATTYVTEFLRAQAASTGKTMADYPKFLTRLPELLAETNKLLDSGDLPVPDLTIGASNSMNKTYFSVFGSRSQALSDLWADVLGRRLIAFTTAGGDYSGSMLEEPGPITQLGLAIPSGVATAPDGTWYVTLKANHVIRKVGPDGNSTILGTFRGDGSISTPEISRTAVPVGELSIPNPKNVACDQDGNLVIGCNDPSAHFLIFVCNKTGPYFGADRQAGMAYPLGNTEVVGTANGTAAARFADGDLATAKFRTPDGMCFDGHGNLYVADRRNNLVRRIDHATGTVSTVAGKLVDNGNGGQMGDQLGTWDGVDNGDGTGAVGAILNRPFQVAWRALDDTHEELYVWEGGNPTDGGALASTGNAIRKIAFDPAHPESGTISTLVGGKEKHGFGGDGGPVAAARIDLVNGDISQDVPDAGMALSADGRYLYFSDTLNFRVRVIDLNANGGPTIDTAAGGGTIEGDTEARLGALKNVAGVAVDSHGNVYVCDETSNVVRKVNYQFGR